MLDARERERPAAAQADLDGTDAPAAPGALRPGECDGDDGGAGLEREPADTALRTAERTRADAGALGKDHDGAAAIQDRAGGVHHLLVRLAAPDRECAERVQQPTLPALLEQLALGDEVHGPAQADPDDERVEEAAVVRGEQDRAAARDVLAAEARRPEPDVDCRLQEAAHDPVDEAIYAAPARAVVVARERAVAVGRVPHHLTYHHGRARVTLRGVSLERSLRGAVAGGIAAAVWAAQQPLDITPRVKVHSAFRQVPAVIRTE